MKMKMIDFHRTEVSTMRRSALEKQMIQRNQPMITRQTMKTMTFQYLHFINELRQTLTINLNEID